MTTYIYILMKNQFTMLGILDSLSIFKTLFLLEKVVVYTNFSMITFLVHLLIPNKIIIGSEATVLWSPLKCINVCLLLLVTEFTVSFTLPNLMHKEGLRHIIEQTCTLDPLFKMRNWSDGGSTSSYNDVKHDIVLLTGV